MGFLLDALRSALTAFETSVASKAVRKWRKVRKSGSCPVPAGQRSTTDSPEDSMVGQALDECPTSGESDVSCGELGVIC